MAQLSLRLLGAYEASLDGRPITSFDSDKVRALLAYLAVESDRPHRREKLAGLLWPDYPERSARTSLRRALANLRTSISDDSADPPFLRITRDSIQFDKAADLRLDEAEFSALTRDFGRGQLERSSLERAVRLYRGAFLEGFSLADSPPFEEWVLVVREKHQARFLSVLLALADEYEGQGQVQRALDFVRQVASLDSYQENAHRQLMRLLASSGQRNEALEHYRFVEKLLQAELGVEPEVETVALYDQIQSGDVTFGRPQEIPAGTVTFLFTDIEASTDLLRDLEEVYTKLLADHHKIFQQVVDRWSGSEVDRQGDAMFLSFPRAADAVHAAVDAQRMLAAHRWPLGASVRVRMALHTGEPWVAGETYVGLDVHKAARIARVGYGGQVLLSLAASELVKEALPPGVRLINLGYFQLKDMELPEAIFQLEVDGLPAQFPTLKARRTKAPRVTEEDSAPPPPSFLEESPDLVERRGAIGREPPFVARERELGLLDGFLQQALEGQGKVAFVCGGPGRGKTALMLEFARRAMQDREDLLVIAGSCNAYSGLGDPYLPFRDALGMLTGDVEEIWRAGAITRQHAVRLWRALPVVLGALVDSGLNIVNSLLSGDALQKRAALSLPADSAVSRRLADYASRRGSGVDDLEQSYLFQQVMNVIHKVAAVHPILILLDDLQWADSASISMFFHLGRRVKDSRILILGAYRQVDVALGREGGRHPLEMVLSQLKREFGDVWLDLGQSREEDDRGFVNSLLDTEPNLLEAPFREALLRHTQGHPLFTIELLRALQVRGTLVRNAAGEWVSAKSLQWDSLPSRVEGVIDEHISRLDAGLRELLDIASVEGENFTLQVLAKIRDMNERELLNLLVHELGKKHRLIVEAGVRQTGDRRFHTFRFRHILYQQYLYNGLGKIEREFLHRDIAGALEQLYERDTREAAPQLAYHFGQAGDHEKAATYLLEAARQAHGRYANKEAIDNYSQALALIPVGEREWKYEVILEREALYALTGDQANRQADLLVLASLSEASENIIKKAEVALRTARYFGTTGDFPEAISKADAAVGLAQTGGLKEIAASAEIEWGRALAFQGDLEQAARHLNQALTWREEAEAEGPTGPAWSRIEAASLNNLAYISNVQGDHDGSKAHLEQALKTYRRLDDRLGESVTLQNLGVVSYDLGDLIHSRDCWVQALAIFREVGDRRHEAMVMNSLGNISSDLVGDYLEAQERHREALAIAVEVGDRSNEGMAIANLGLAALGLKEYARAKDETEQALAIYQELNLKPALGESYFILGESLAGLERPAEAIEAYEQAIRSGEDLGQVDAILKAQAGLARVALEDGELEAARRRVEAIMTRLEEDRLAEELESETRYQVYLTCSRVLRTAGEARGSELLEQVHRELQERASLIEDPNIRQGYLEKVRWHREIVEAYSLHIKESEEE